MYRTPFLPAPGYREGIDEWRETLARECGQHQIDYVPLDTGTPFDVALIAYLNKRARMS